MASATRDLEISTAYLPTGRDENGLEGPRGLKTTQAVPDTKSPSTKSSQVPYSEGTA